MALRLISCSPRSGRARCHRRPRITSATLDASIGASGPHDFTVRIRTVRQRHIRVHRIPSRACDDRETPLVSGRDENAILLIWVDRQVNFGKSEMDAVTKIIVTPAALWATVVGLVALLPLGFGIYWLFNKQARLRDLAELRRKLDELGVSDPEYGAVRALYTSMMVDAERWGFINSSSRSGGDGEGADHSGGDHVGDGNSGGDH